MPEGAVIDTDVLMKAAAYRWVDDLCGTLAPLGLPGALGLTHLIAAKQLSRAKGRLIDTRGAVAEIQRLLGKLAKIEPTEAEIDLAASLDEAALTEGFPLDSGESQLVAILISRDLPLLLTGDKRAISCLEDVLCVVGRAGCCTSRIACLEQFVIALVARHGPSSIRARVCTEPMMDTALRLCCNCGRDEFEAHAVSESLESYIKHARETGRGVLFQGCLSALA